MLMSMIDLASVNLELELCKHVNYICCSTPHVAALALQALKAPLACTLASGYAIVTIVELQCKQMSTALTV